MDDLNSKVNQIINTIERNFSLQQNNQSMDKIIDPWKKVYSYLKNTRDFDATKKMISVFLSDQKHFNSRHQKTYFEILKNSFINLKFDNPEEALTIMGWAIRIAQYKFKKS